MATKIAVIYDNPLDPAEFELAYAKEQVALAKSLPNVLRVESSKVWPKEDGTPTPAYRLLDLYFADYEAASAAVTTPQASALFSSITEMATGGVRIVFAQIEEP
jgi:uncharacterized protein (TIGR02118 family)